MIELDNLSHLLNAQKTQKPGIQRSPVDQILCYNWTIRLAISQYQDNECRNKSNPTNSKGQIIYHTNRILTMSRMIGGVHEDKN